MTLQDVKTALQQAGIPVEDSHTAGGDPNLTAGAFTLIVAEDDLVEVYHTDTGDHQLMELDEAVEFLRPNPQDFDRPDQEEDDPVQELGPPATDVHECYAVYKDYDGEAPDSETLVYCATEALAARVVSWCNRHDNGDGSETDIDGIQQYGFPFSDGSEWAASYQARKAVACAAEIKRTLKDSIREFEE